MPDLKPVRSASDSNNESPRSPERPVEPISNLLARVDRHIRTNPAPANIYEYLDQPTPDHEPKTELDPSQQTRPIMTLHQLATRRASESSSASPVPKPSEVPEDQQRMLVRRARALTKPIPAIKPPDDTVPPLAVSLPTSPGRTSVPSVEPSPSMFSASYDSPSLSPSRATSLGAASLYSVSTASSPIPDIQKLVITEDKAHEDIPGVQQVISAIYQVDATGDAIDVKDKVVKLLDANTISFGGRELNDHFGDPATYWSRLMPGKGTSKSLIMQVVKLPTFDVPTH